MSDIRALSDAAFAGELPPQAYLGMGLGLVEVVPGVRFWPGFGNAAVVETGAGLALVDTGNEMGAAAFAAALATGTDATVDTVVYTHGHIDHVMGMAALEARQVVAHELVGPRFDRYAATAGYNGAINRRQFGLAHLEWPTSYRRPDITYRETLSLDVGGVRLELAHGRGETDDATMVWLPEQRVLCCGDFFMWSSPNAGNPQKVQRYAVDWAVALRRMAALGAEVLLPGHGLPLFGAERVAGALTSSATLLESLHEQTLALMNRGASLDEVLASVTAPQELLDLPWLGPTYDEPEFVVRNLWRLYGGWWDGDPASLKPAPRSALAAELASLAGGADALSQRAAQLVDAGEDRLAAHLAQLAVDADPQSVTAHDTRRRVFEVLRDRATSTMAKGVYGAAARESAAQPSK